MNMIATTHGSEWRVSDTLSLLVRRHWLCRRVLSPVVELFSLRLARHLRWHWAQAHVARITGPSLTVGWKQ